MSFSSHDLKNALRPVRDAAATAAAVSVSALVKMLPRRVKIRIAPRIRTIGFMDYASARIKMIVESPTELGRLRSCLKEPGTVAWLDEHMGPDDVLYDIGANVGAYSLIAGSKIGPGLGKVVAFEPSFRNYARLNENIEVNGLSKQVIPLSIALSDAACIVTFQFSSTEPGAALHNMMGATLRTNARPAVAESNVPAMRLDELVEKFNLPHPTMIKLDVDGPEFEVLKGAGALLEDPALKTILVEVEPDETVRRNIRDHLESRGWKIKATNHHHGNAVDEDWVLVREPQPPL